MTNDLIDVSIVMCAYTQDRWIDMQHAIQSLQSQTVLPREIILVIDHNPDLKELARKTFKGVTVVENQEERGLSGARNTGIVHSSGLVVAFIDEDAIASPNWIESLLDGYQNPQVIGVGGEVKPVWTVPQPDWFPEEFNWVVGCSYKGLPLSLSSIRNPIGCNMSFRREALVYAGGFRNGIGRVGTIPIGCEETELCIRARQCSPMSVFIYQPNAVVYHKVPEWRSSWRYFARRCFAEGLSKAMVTRYVGSKDGLSSERSYVLRTLPNAMLSGLKETFLHGNFAGIKRALTIAAGLSLTTAGFITGVVKRLWIKNSSTHESTTLSPQLKGETKNKEPFWLGDS